jgi:GDP-4-dehydro-6-deoxy-D-mannose reductase
VRVLISGIAGFAGSHLADHLLAEDGPEVHGVVRPQSPTPNIAHLCERLTLHPADLRDYPAVRRVLAAVRPERVYHLAARASVAASWRDPERTLVDNIVMQLNLLRALGELDLAPRVLVVGSADEYGLVPPAELPVSEATPLRPLNPYAVSKIAQDYLGAQYHLARGLHVVRVRPFNHLGPRQGPGFVAPDFASQIARIEAGRAEPVIRVGNLSARRDFTDVRDVARAYRLALERGEAGAVYNIGSARSHAIQEILDGLLALSPARVRVEEDPARIRPSDTPEIVCDARLFHEATGWRPRRTLEESLRDVLDEWREIVRREP